MRPMGIQIKQSGQNAVSRTSAVKTALCLSLTLVLLIGLCACRDVTVVADDTLLIVCTLFPQYDFARTITEGRSADVRLILPPGVESHVFEPTPGDIHLIEQADVLIYTGAEMEPWVERVLSSLDHSGLTVVDGSQSIRYPLNAEAHDHEGHAQEESHEHEEDPHFWLDLRNASAFALDIGECLAEEDASGAESYRAAAETLSSELLRLDAAFLEAAQTGKRDCVVFGGRFAWAYFVERYGLAYRSLYDGCSTETEPSLKAMLNTEAYIRDNSIPVIFREELTTGAAAETLAQSTGARVEELHTGHNVSKEDKASGRTFLQVFERNLEVLRAALNE